MEQFSRDHSVLSSETSDSCLQPKTSLPGSELHPAVQKALQTHLFQPADELRRRPSHGFRSQLVRLGFDLCSASTPTARDLQNLKICAESIEHLHMGSLIIDDIQDGSTVRRNGQSLHCLLGAPQALGVGNWLYFYALRHLSRLDVSQALQKALYEVYIEAVELAHYGQIMDLCVKVDQVPVVEIETLSEACMRYKTGSIVVLALMLGAHLAGADPVRQKAVERLGYALGIYLQRRNDLGNCLSDFDPEKKWEDLVHRKPSYIWGFVARAYGTEALQELISAVQALPESRPWEDWLKRYDLGRDAKALAEREIDQAVRDYKNAACVSWRELRPLAQLKERIEKAYG